MAKNKKVRKPGQAARQPARLLESARRPLYGYIPGNFQELQIKSQEGERYKKMSFQSEKRKTHGGSEKTSPSSLWQEAAVYPRLHTAVWTTKPFGKKIPEKTTRPESAYSGAVPKKAPPRPGIPVKQDRTKISAQ